VVGFFSESELSPTYSSSREQIIASIRAQNRSNVHNFSIGTLSCYFRLLSLPDDNVLWEDCVLFLSGLPGAARRKTFVYKSECAPNLLRKWRTEGVVYSINNIGAGAGKFSETVYDLDAVFSRNSYPSSNKYYRRITSPLNWMAARYDVRPIYISDRQAVSRLHSKWVAYKIAQPDTFKMMFPKARYLRCLDIALARPHEYTTFGAFTHTGELQAVRVVSIEAAIVYDLAFFANTWDAPSNLVEHFAVFGMKRLHELGCRTLNTGSGLNKKLSAYKEHWPFSHLISYAYPKLPGA